MQILSEISNKLGNPSLISWGLTCFSTLLAYVFKRLNRKYNKILKEGKEIKEDLLRIETELTVMSKVVEMNIDLSNANIEALKLFLSKSK